MSEYTLEYIGEDDWSRALFKYTNLETEKSTTLVDVDGTLYTRTEDWGEPVTATRFSTPEIKTREIVLESCQYWVNQISILRPDKVYSFTYTKTIHILKGQSGIPLYASDDVDQFHEYVHGYYNALKDILGRDEVSRLEREYAEIIEED